jgi:AraC family transcriptional regulator of adaptative response/methylated-DNA-[protein]-cysteine methyltransferase
VPGDHTHLAHVEEELGEYFAGVRTEFTVPIAVPGTDFQQACWDYLRTVPYGETRSYAEQANALGRRAAVRAVGRANGDNRLAVVIPCHRVVRTDGELAGYGGGVWRKRLLVTFERLNRETIDGGGTPIPIAEAGINT